MIDRGQRTTELISLIEHMIRFDNIWVIHVWHKVGINRWTDK